MTQRRNHAVKPGMSRRGHIYIAVLSVALIVLITGMSAILLARNDLRAASMAQDTVQADLSAQSLIDLAALWITSDPNWRTTYTNNTWTAPQTVGGVTLRFKLVDELDGNLADDPNEPARLYAKATVGDAVRMYSVRLNPQPFTNLVSNPGTEDGTTNWLSWNCHLTSKTSEFHGGAKSLLISNRASIDAEAYQLVTSSIENGATYYVELWAKLKNPGTDQVTISLKIVRGAATTLFTTAPTTVNNTWTKVSGTLTPTWTGTLTEARWRTFTYPSGSTSDYYIDDALTQKVSSSPSVIPVPGTWRREVDSTPFLIPVAPDPAPKGIELLTK